jgi:hypothetical protein
VCSSDLKAFHTVMQVDDYKCFFQLWRQSVSAQLVKTEIPSVIKSSQLHIRAKNAPNLNFHLLQVMQHYIAVSFQLFLSEEMCSIQSGSFLIPVTKVCLGSLNTL